MTRRERINARCQQLHAAIQEVLNSNTLPDAEEEAQASMIVCSVLSGYTFARGGFDDVRYIRAFHVGVDQQTVGATLAAAGTNAAGREVKL